MNSQKHVQPLTSAITEKCGDGVSLSIVKACFDSQAWEQRMKEVGLIFFYVINQEKIWSASSVIVLGMTVVWYPVI